METVPVKVYRVATTKQSIAYCTNDKPDRLLVRDFVDVQTVTPILAVILKVT